MRMLQRCASAFEVLALYGPANLAALSAMVFVSGFLSFQRLLNRGYHRFLFSSK
jgi:hypothetical protein